jgi:hypothetical protein
LTFAPASSLGSLMPAFCRCVLDVGALTSRCLVPELLLTLTAFAIAACVAAYAADHIPQVWVDWCVEVLR